MNCPKPSRVVDKELIEEIRSEGQCRLAKFGHCSGPLDVHHIKSRGSGGGDVRGNLILLCRHHHQMTHNGLIPKKLLIAESL